MENWCEYWKKFDKLTDELKENGKNEFSNQLCNIKTLVNGLTDGWFEFKNGFENCIKQNEYKLDDIEIKKSEELLKNLNDSLKNR